MIVATRLWRFVFKQMFIMLSLSSMSYAMVWDNRYFPWMDQLFTASDNTHGFLNSNIFFVTGGDAFRRQDRSQREEQIISVPELFGELSLIKVANAFTKVGLPNPIPVDWRGSESIAAKMPAWVDGQGVAMAAYAPLTSFLGIGGSVLMMRVNSFMQVVPAEETVKNLHLDAPASQAMFAQTVHSIYEQLGICSTSSNEVGVGDVVAYLKVYRTYEYEYKCRKFDLSLNFGVIIPSGLQRNIYNLGSIPLGGEHGHWGLFIAPHIELELKDDLRFGLYGRLTQRIDRSFYGRAPIADEHPWFAPVKGSIGLDSGVTLSIAPYFIFEDLRAGFGIQAQYTLTHHEPDNFVTKINDSKLRPDFHCMILDSGWTQEFATIRLFYDFAHDGAMKIAPVFSCTWDIPMNHLHGRGFAKTHRLSLGCNVNF